MKMLNLLAWGAAIPLLAATTAGQEASLAFAHVAVDAGLTPADALRAATLNAARLFPKLDAGEVAAGKRADLVLLDANPLRDIRNASRTRAVVLSGRLFDRARLDRLLAEAVAQAAVH